MPDELNPDAGTEPETLSLDEAAAKYSSVTPKPEPEQGQPDEDADAVEAADQDQPTEEVGEGEEGKPDDEGQPEDEDDNEPESEQGRFVAQNARVKLPDGTTATVADLIGGNLRDRDYRQKTMELAESRKAHEAQSSALQQERTSLTEQRTYMEALLKSIVPARPDPSLATTNPQDYVQQMAAFEYWQGHLSHIQSETTKSAKELEAKAKGDRESREKAEWTSLIEKAPDLQDDGKLKSFTEDLRKYGGEYGFTPAEISAQLPVDHRLALVMRDAMRWKKFQASKANATKAAKEAPARPPVQRGSARLSPGQAQARAQDAAINRLKQTGSVDDAAAAYLARQKG